VKNVNYKNYLRYLLGFIFLWYHLNVKSVFVAQNHEVNFRMMANHGLGPPWPRLWLTMAARSDWKLVTGHVRPGSTNAKAGPEIFMDELMAWITWIMYAPANCLRCGISTIWRIICLENHTFLTCLF
jgi:hypothetical protein